MINKTYLCDICGKEAPDTPFILPAATKFEAKNGKGRVVMQFNAGIKPHEMLLCYSCQSKIYQMLCLMKKLEIEE